MQVPRYIKDALIPDTSIRYEWDDWNIEVAQEPFDEPLHLRLKQISKRANIAFTIATAEWIVHRFSTIADVELCWEYLECAWAQVIDWRYGTFSGWEERVNEADWRGPIKNPLHTAMRRVVFAIQQAYDPEGNPSRRATWISSLAIYVITKPEPYLQWREWVLTRLESLYPREIGNAVGAVVPQEALDPNEDFSLEKTEPLMNRFLQSCRPGLNQFLNTPEEMLRLGFEGIPYVFTVAEDAPGQTA